jgi:hypothetical protein
MRVRTIVLGYLLLSVACTSEPTTLGNACEPGLSISISTSAAPEFTWQPQCAVGTLHVAKEGAGIAWQINSNSRADFTPHNQIESGVVYGVVPAGAHEFALAQPLEAGKTYRLFLNVTDSQGNQQEVGAATFTAMAN